MESVGVAAGSIKHDKRLPLAADPIIGLVITLVILKITWDSWNTVRASTNDLDYVEEH